jgi:DMSO/TMAO reductase YedYZ molybdopterin-dependent catalytic subunit
MRTPTSASRRRAAVAGGLAALVASTGLVASSSGPAQAAEARPAALQAANPCTTVEVNIPQRTGSLTPKVTVRASISCGGVIVGNLYLDVTVMHLGGSGKQTTKVHDKHFGARLDGVVSQACISGWYRGKALWGVDTGSEFFFGTAYAQSDVYIDCS